MDKNQISNRVKDLQDDIATMRKDAPKYYSEMLKKEFTAVHNYFAQADFKGIDEPQVNSESMKSTYVIENLQDVSTNGKLILLNAKIDTLLKCKEYLNK